MKENTLKTKKIPGKCPRCGSEKVKIHEHYSRLIRDLDAGGNIVERKLDGVRFQCMNCKKTFTPSLVEGSSMTGRLLRKIADDLSRFDVMPKTYSRDIGVPANTLNRNLKEYYKSENHKSEILAPQSLYLFYWQEMILYVDLDTEMIVEAGHISQPLETLIKRAQYLAVSDAVLEKIPVIQTAIQKTGLKKTETLVDVDKRIRSTLGIPKNRKVRTGRDPEFIRNRILYGGNRQKPKFSNITGKLVRGSGRILA